ncbi:MAG: tetratricopeptide repeat protein, partial [Cyanobacteria bacterium HKST-UBA02]|nr:tetratricopeptide repeat protein [Cyanobacteria bacterium HKST-UBA02]
GLLFSFNAPVWGTDYFEQGKQFYAKGRYPEAWRCLKQVTSQVPTNWQAQYLLGNISLKLGHHDEARDAYERCILAGPDPQTAAHCKAALDHIAATGKTADIKKKLAESEENRRVVRDERELKTYSKKLQLAIRRREKILTEAREAASRIRHEVQERIRRETEESQTVGITRSGEVITGLPEWYVNQLLADAEARIRSIINDAEARAKGIYVPEAPTLHSDKFTRDESSEESGK